MARGRPSALASLAWVSLSGKWLELLKEIAPGVTRAAVLRDPAISSGIGQWGAIQTAAPSFGIEVNPVNVRDTGEIERAVATFARSANGGLIVTASALSAVHADQIIALAAQHKLPAVYFQHRFVSRGGLISYGPDIVDQFRRAGNFPLSQRYQRFRRILAGPIFLRGRVRGRGLRNSMFAPDE